MDMQQIIRNVNVEDDKVFGLKSHDSNVVLQTLIPTVFEVA